MRTATVWIENGVFALLFRPYQGAFGGSNVPAPGNLLNQGKNNANARGGGGGGLHIVKAFRSARARCPGFLSNFSRKHFLRRLICLDYIRRIQNEILL